MTVFLFGAGSTYGTLRNHTVCPPLAPGFGRYLTQLALEDDYPNLAAVAAHLNRDLSKLSLEEIWSCIDYYAKFAKRRGGFLQNPKWLPGAVCELKRAILSLYGDRCDKAARAVKQSSTLVSLLKRVQERDAIVSFNYDTLVERVARKFKLRLRHGAGPVQKRAGRDGSTRSDGDREREPTTDKRDNDDRPGLFGSGPVAIVVA